MKKYTILLLTIFCLFLTGCGNNKVKEVKTLNDFEEICTNNEFTVDDNMLNYTDKEITGAKIAKFDNEHIEMVIYEDDKYAKKVQDGHIDDFMKIRNTMVTVDKDKGKNYYNFKMVSNGYYWISTRIENTLIFGKVPIDYKEKVDTVLNSLGY